jgi:hypothetical protein
MSKQSKQVKATTPTQASALQVAPPIAQQVSYSFGPKQAGPRTSGQAGQASATQVAWQAVAQCITANGGVATHAQLTTALAAVNLQFKTYVPYFTTKCHWLVAVAPVTANA